MYAIILGQPETGKELLLESFSLDNSNQPITVSIVSLAGTEETMTWELTDVDLIAQLPDGGLDEMVVALKIETGQY